MTHSENDTSGTRVPGLYPWPYDGELRADNTCLVVLGMQGDYCLPGGWMDRRGDDLSMIRAIRPAVTAHVAQMRRAGFPVVFIRESHRPDLRDLPPNKLWRSQQAGAGIGAEGPLGRHLVRGAPGCDILPELTPAAGDEIIDTCGKSGFYESDLDQILRQRGLRNLILIGATTDGLVQATLRDANDRGYECLVVRDLCATTRAAHHDEQIAMLALAGGLWGSVTTAADLIATLEGRP